MSEDLSQSASLVVSAARTQVAEEGLRGLSLRKVATRAGNSRGGVMSQAGGKAGLVASLIADALEFQRRKHKRWLALTAGLDTSSSDVIATIIRSFLNEAVTQEREQSLVLCELVAESARKKEHHRDLVELIREEDIFWRDMQRNAPDGDILGWAITNYYRDELPFALALQGNAEYHLLRSATIARLAQRFAGIGGRGFAQGFDRFISQADAQPDVGAEKQSRKLLRLQEIGRATAGLIKREGVTGVSHRSVAAAANIPKSSIANHFRTREDLLRAGLSEIYREVTATVSLSAPKDAVPDMALSIASHSIAVEAVRDPSLLPSALNLRKMRGEFIWQKLADWLGPNKSDVAALQATSMIIVGSGLALHLAGGDMFLPMIKLSRLIGGDETPPA